MQEHRNLLIKNLNAIYFEVEESNKLVQKKLPFISCPEGCSECCTGAGLPAVTTLEWQEIEKYWFENLSEEQRLKIKSKLSYLLFNFGKIYHFLSSNIGRAPSQKEWLILSPILNGSSCPFLSETGRCEVYEVRPLVCRTFGYYFRDNKNNIEPATCKKDYKKFQENEGWEKKLDQIPLEKKVIAKINQLTVKDNLNDWEIIPIRLAKFLEINYTKPKESSLADLINPFLENLINKGLKLGYDLIEFLILNNFADSKTFVILCEQQLKDGDYEKALNTVKTAIREGKSSIELKELTKTIINKLNNKT